MLSDVCFFSVPKPPKVDFSRVPQEVVLKKGETLKLDVPFVGKFEGSAVPKMQLYS